MMLKTTDSPALRRLASGCAVAAAASLLATGCGGDDGDTSKSQADTADQASTTSQDAKKDETSTSTTPEKAEKGKSGKSSKIKGDLKPAPAPKGKKRGVPASASAYVGLLTQKLSAGQAGNAGGKVGGAGTWRIAMGEGAYTLYGPKGLVTSGTVKVSKGRATLASLPPAKQPKSNLPAAKGKNKQAKLPKPAPDPCKGKRGVYRISVKAKRVTFAKVSESCADRAVLATGSWANMSPRDG